MGPLTLLLRGERFCARPGEGAGQLGEDGQVGVKLDPLKATDAQRGERPFVLQAAELALNSGAASVASFARAS